MAFSFAEPFFWHTESKFFYFRGLCLASFLGRVMIHLFWCHGKGTWVPEIFGIAVHSYTGIQMWISWTPGLQSIAQASTNKQEYEMIQAYQFFNKLVANPSSIKVKQEGQTRKGMHRAYSLNLHLNIITSVSPLCRVLFHEWHEDTFAGTLLP